MALWGEPGAMIDGMYTLTLMTLAYMQSITSIIPLYILSVQATVRLHEQVDGILETCTNISSWDIANQYSNCSDTYMCASQVALYKQ